MVKYKLHNISRFSQMAMNFNKRISPEIPEELLNEPDLVTSEGSIVSRRQVQLTPINGTAFGSQSASSVVSSSNLVDRIRFQINDSSHFLNLKDSYIQAEFKAVAKTSGDAALVSYLDEGGIHSCIKSVTLNMGSVELARINDYNKWYNATYRNQQHNLDEIEYLLHDQGDSVNDLSSLDEERLLKSVTSTIADVSITNAGVITLTGGAADDELRVGDILNITYSVDAAVDVAYSVDATVTVITDADTLTVAPWSTTVAATFVKSIQLVSRDIRESRRSQMVNNASDQRLNIRLPLGMFMIDEFLPLPLIKEGLELELEMENHNLAIVLQNDASTNKVGYVLNNCRLMADMLGVSPQVADMYKSLYNTDGVAFRYLNWIHNEISVPSSTSNVLTVKQNLSSVHSMVMVMTNTSLANSSEYTSSAYKSNSTFLPQNISSYRVLNGSEMFPYYGSVQFTKDAYGVEAYKQMKIAFNNNDKNAIKPYDYYNTKFIIAQSMKKYPGYDSGANISQSFLEVALEQTSGSAHTAHIWLSYDQVVVISATGSRVFK